jgi:hypothetical protein
MKVAALVCAPLALLALLALAGPSVAADDPKVGDEVWAEWVPNAWYKGKVARKTDKGYDIDFDDGDKATALDGSKVALDKAPDKKAVKKGTRVLASWSDGNFYPGKVDKVIYGGDYHIQYDDGDEGDAELKDLRLIGRGTL